MSEYIEREALMENMRNGLFPNEKIETPFDVLRAIEQAPTADVVEVKHGYWIDKSSGRHLHIASWCSVCGNKSGIGGIESNRHKPYCPNCGAKMDNTPKERGADKPKITCLNCKHLMFSDMYGECNKQLRIVKPSDTCEYAEPKERGGENG